MAARIAERIASFQAAPESFDPADLDTLGDDTAARARPRPSVEVSGEDASAARPEKGRLRLRQGTPVLAKYKGRKVNRHEVFGDEPAATREAPDEEKADEDDSEGDGGGGGALGVAAGGFSITNELEQEYESMMGQMRQDLEIMRTPSATEVARREGEADRLREELKVWSGLLELRIHLESALAIGHRLPVGSSSAAFRESDPAISSQADGAAGEVRRFLGELLALQQTLAERRGTPVGRSGAGGPPAGDQQPPPRGEAEAWASVDARLEPVLDWGLGVADQWKERTRLDTRRSFKVLDQSLSAQMQAFAAMDAEKLRRRCTPPPGKHKIFGGAATRAAAKAVGAAAEEKGGTVQDDNRDAHQAELEEVQEIFDDREFYVQLLKEIATGGEGGGASMGFTDVNTKELQAEFEGRRAAKKRARADVERRASKGRKIRYVPIEKLQNFMAPRPRSANGNEEGALEEKKVEAILRALFSGGLAPP